jgi:D-threo-aldose 1-dehydrogenase
VRAADRRTVGRTDAWVTRLGFGGTAIGNLFAARTEREAADTLASAWDAGIRYFDTAPLYGLTLSETRIGRFLASRPRNDFSISTKVGRMLVPLGEGEPPVAAYVDVPRLRPHYDFTGDAILRCFEGSLVRLGLERVDILYLHDLTPMNMRSEEAYRHHFRVFFEQGGHEAMVRLRGEGSVGAIGIGVGDWRAAEELMTHGDFDACLLAGRYTLLEQEALASFLPLCERRNVGVVIGGPYNSGILATGAVPGALYNYHPAPPDVLARVAAIEATCRDFGTPLAAVALQFPLHHPAVVSVIPGAGSSREVATAVETMECRIPPGLYSALKARGLLAAGAPTP